MFIVVRTFRNFTVYNILLEKFTFWNEILLNFTDVPETVISLFLKALPRRQPTCLGRSESTATKLALDPIPRSFLSSSLLQLLDPPQGRKDAGVGRG